MKKFRNKMQLIVFPNESLHFQKVSQSFPDDLFIHISRNVYELLKYPFKKIQNHIPIDM